MIVLIFAGSFLDRFQLQGLWIILLGFAGNVVWLDAAGPVRALIGLSCPILPREVDLKKSRRANKVKSSKKVCMLFFFGVIPVNIMICILINEFVNVVFNENI